MMTAKAPWKRCASESSPLIPSAHGGYFPQLRAILSPHLPLPCRPPNSLLQLFRHVLHLGARVWQRALGDGGSRQVRQPSRPPNFHIVNPKPKPYHPLNPTQAENGLWAGANRTTPSNTPQTSPFVFAMVKGGSNGFALKGGDATMGALTLLYDGARPPRYQPMKKQGAIILGIGEFREPPLLAEKPCPQIKNFPSPPLLTPGGDNSNEAIGTFYEGAITAGYTTDAIDAAVAANVAAAGYGK